MKNIQFIEKITFEEVNLALQLNKVADFEAGVLNSDHAYRITPGMLSENQRTVIREAIAIMDSEDLMEINQKDGLYKIFRSYSDTSPIGYLLYRAKGTEGISYSFSNNLKILAKKNIENPQIKLEPLQILPTDWIKMRNEKYNNAETDLDKEFVDRTNFENFTVDKLTALEEKLSNALKISPNNDKLKAQSATLLMQKLPNREKLERAFELFDSIKNEEILEEYSEVKETVIDMLRPQPTKTTITRVNWGVFNRCPLTCRGCYNIFNSDVIDINQCKEILDKIADAGTTELIISGGDPLLWPDLVEFCKYAKGKGLKIGIDTVTYNLNPHLLYNLKDLVAYIGVPVDGTDQKTIETFRRGKKDLLDKLLYSLSLADAFSVPIRLNTTVSKRNVDALDGIAQIVEKHKSVQTWSIYQWWPLRSGDKLADQMILETSKFENAVHTIKNKYEDIKIYDRAIEDRARNAFFISSNGEVYTFGKSSQISTIILGDIKTQSIGDILKNPALKKTSQKFKSIARFNSNALEAPKKLVA